MKRKTQSAIFELWNKKETLRSIILIWCQRSADVQTARGTHFIASKLDLRRIPVDLHTVRRLCKICFASNSNWTTISTTVLEHTHFSDFKRPPDKYRRALPFNLSKTALNAGATVGSAHRKTVRGLSKMIYSSAIICSTDGVDYNSRNSKEVQWRLVPAWKLLETSVTVTYLRWNIHRPFWDLSSSVRRSPATTKMLNNKKQKRYAAFLSVVEAC